LYSPRVFVYEFMYAVLENMSTLSPSCEWIPLYPFQNATLFATKIRPPFFELLVPL
jgi:hypothetical protein